MDITHAFDDAYVHRETVTRNGERCIPEEKWDAYIESLEPVDQEIVRKVKKYTLYVPYSELLENLHASFDKFVDKIEDKPFHVLLPSKFASETLLIVELWSRIKNLNFQGFISLSSKLTESTDILIIDDASYSGINVYSHMDNISYDNKNIEFRFHIVVPYISKSALMLFARPFSECQLVKKTLYNMVGTCSIEGMDPELLYERYKLETSPVPLYFDHKIGNCFATFTTVYMGYNPSNPDKSCKSLLPYPPDEDIKTRIWKSYFKRFLDIPSHV